MQPYIRNYNYINDFYWTQNQWASNLSVPAYPVTYYSVDFENSVYDKNLMAGSYEHHGVGELSGIKWRKIQMLPVYHVEQMSLQFSADEKGVTMGDSELGSVVIPSNYDINPVEWDFIHFDQKFMFNKSDISPIFVVRGVDPSTFGSVRYNRVNIKPSSSDTLQKLELQLSGRYMFLEFTKKIHEIQTASLLLKLQSRHEKLSSNLMNLYSSTGLYMVP